MRMENEVETAMRKQIDELSRMTVGQLRPKYLQVFGEESRSNHRQFLFRRIAWRIQALAEGGLLVNGFEFDGEIYRSLSAIASEVAGTKWNGFLFFNLTSTEENPNGKE
jgi:hypothetical protein